MKNELYTLITRTDEEIPQFNFIGTYDDKEKLYAVIDDDFRYYGSELDTHYEVLHDGQTEFLIIENDLNDAHTIKLNNTIYDEDWMWYVFSTRIIHI